jgi:heat shock protein HslJ
MSITTHGRSHRHRLRRLRPHALALGACAAGAITASCATAADVRSSRSTTPSSVTAPSNTPTDTTTARTRSTIEAAPAASVSDVTDVTEVGPLRIVLYTSVTGTDDPTDVMAWQTLIDIDPMSEYAYLGRRGEAERGDVGCLELLHVDGVGYGRTYPIPGNPEFDASDSLGTFDAVLSGLPITIDQLAALTGGQPVADGEGFALSTDLTDADIEALDNTLFSPGSFGGDSFESGVVDATAGSNGILRSAGFVFEHASGERLVLDVTMIDLAADDRVSSSDTIESTGWCSSMWDDSAAPPIASWLITAVADGDAIFDEEVSRTPLLVVHQDGTVTGNTGCSVIAGTATLDDEAVSGFEVRVSGSSCPDEHLARERTVITALNQGSTTIGHAGAFSYGVEGAETVVLVPVGK